MSTETTSTYLRRPYFDADKRLGDPTDDDLCWAAAASNQLWAAQWGRLANVDDEESLLFDFYQPNFPAAGGHNYPALRWFLEGKGYRTLVVQELADEESWKGVVFSRIPGGWYQSTLRNKNDWATRNIKLLQLQGTRKTLLECVAYLKQGAAVNVNLRAYNQNTGEGYGGHAITLWGIVYSNSYPENDPRYVKAIVVSDSDDYQGRAQPFHACPYVEQTPERAVFAIPVTWHGCRFARARQRGCWVLDAAYSGGGQFAATQAVLTDAVVILPKPDVYDPAPANARALDPDLD